MPNITRFLARILAEIFVKAVAGTEHGTRVPHAEDNRHRVPCFAIGGKPADSRAKCNRTSILRRWRQISATSTNREASKEEKYQSLAITFQHRVSVSLIFMTMAIIAPSSMLSCTVDQLKIVISWSVSVRLMKLVLLRCCADVCGGSRIISLKYECSNMKS